jgi:SAM-dependent methyltransferase
VSAARRRLRRVLRGPLEPGVFDDARRIVQLPAMQRLTEHWPLRGAVLDAGSGRSGMYDAFIDGFAGVTRVAHVDLDPPGDAPREGRHSYHRASLTELPFADATFDAAVCLEVLEHIEDDASATRELARVVRPGGLLLVSTPTPPAPADPAHVREGYTDRELDALLRAAGFATVAWERCMHGPLRALMAAYRVQGRLLFGDSRLAYVPASVVRAVARADERWPAGAPWDIVALAVRAG